MSLTPAQKATLKAHIAANTNQIGGEAINALPMSTDANVAIAAWYNAVASPNFWAWRMTVTRREVYFGISDLGSVFNFDTYKAQSQGEQGAWTQMFMGDSAPYDSLAFRNGVFAVFSGSAPQNSQRAHIFAVGRRVTKRVEGVFATAPVSGGGVTVGVDNGNTVAQPLGSTANPAVMGYEGSVTSDEVEAARQLQ